MSTKRRIPNNMVSINGTITDAYAHTGLPRFQSVADYRAVMRQSGVDRAVLCAFDSAPDLAPIHAAFSEEPERFRGIGIPLGNDAREMEAAAHAQLGAGFSGLRLSDADVVERGFLLDIIAEHQAIVVLAGSMSRGQCPHALARALDRHPELKVVAVHFAGGGTPDLLQNGPVADLISHQRLSIAFSRHGGFQTDFIRAWAEALLARMGWERLLWGSEAPVLFWRNETVDSALNWVDVLTPTAEQRTLFFTENARRIYFDKPVRAAPLVMPFDPFSRLREIPATLFANGWPLDQAIAGRLVQHWRRTGTSKQLGDHLAVLLDQALPETEPDAGNRQETADAAPGRK